MAETRETTASKPQKKRWRRRVAWLLVLASVGPVWYLSRLWQRPSHRSVTRSLFPGVTYFRTYRKAQKQLWHLLRIELDAPGLRFFVTPGDSRRWMTHEAMTTSGFLRRYRLQAAINGGFFGPFYAGLPWSYYPRVGEPVHPLNLVISDGQQATLAKITNRPALCVSRDQRPTIRPRPCPQGTYQALGGGPLLIYKGRHSRRLVHLHRSALARWSPGSRRRPPLSRLAPRTAVALEPDEQVMWWIVVDGRQGNYSKGISMLDLMWWGVAMGFDAMLNLDGGGSTTLVIDDAGEPKVLNAPFHTRIPMRERPVATHLGLYVKRAP